MREFSFDGAIKIGTPFELPEASAIRLCQRTQVDGSDKYPAARVPRAHKFTAVRNILLRREFLVHTKFTADIRVDVLVREYLARASSQFTDVLLRHELIL